MHKHSRQKTYDYGYSACVDPDGCDPIAHGNITRIDFCACGAERRENINAGHHEKGGWHETSKRQAGSTSTGS